MNLKNTNLNELMRNAADILLAKLSQLTKSHPAVSLAICGGRSVTALLDILATNKEPFWKKVHFFLADERIVPVDSPDSNFALLWQKFFEPSITAGIINRSQVHAPEINLADPQKTVRLYSEEFKKNFSKLDVAILASGEDAHVASLFPNHPSIRDTSQEFILVNNSPKPPPQRLSCSASLLANSTFGLLMFLGEAKRNALANYNNNQLTLADCPAKIVDRMKEKLIISDIT